MFLFILTYVTGSVSVEKEDSLATSATKPFLQKGSLSEVFLGMKVGGFSSVGGGSCGDSTIIPDQEVHTDKEQQHHVSIEPEITSEEIVNDTGLPPLKPPSFYNNIKTFVPITKTRNTTTSSTTKKKVQPPKNSKCNECSKIHGHTFYPLQGFRVHERVGPLVPISKKPMDFSQKQHLHILLHQKNLSITDAILCLDSHPFPLFQLATSSLLTATAVRTLDQTHLLWSLPTVMWSTVILILLTTLLVTLDYIVYDVSKTIWYSARGGGGGFSPTFFFSKDGLSFIVQHFKYSLFGGTFPLLSNYRKASMYSGAGGLGGRRSSPSQLQQQQQIKRKKSKRFSIHPQTPPAPPTTPAVAKVHQPSQPLAMPSPQRRHHSISFSLNESIAPSAVSSGVGTVDYSAAEDFTDSFDVKVNRSNRKKRSSVQQRNLNDDSGIVGGDGGGPSTPSAFNDFVSYGRTSSPTPTPPTPTLTSSPSPSLVIPSPPVFEVGNEDLDRRRADWVRGMPLFECATATIVGPPISTPVGQPLSAAVGKAVPTAERPSRRFTIHSSSSTIAPPTSPTIQRQTIPTPPPGFDNIVTVGAGGTSTTLSTSSSQQSSIFAFPSRTTTTFTDNENSWLWFLPSSYGGTTATDNSNNGTMADSDDPPRGGQFARFSLSGRSTPSGASSDELD